MKENSNINILFLIEYFQSNYPNIEKTPVHLITGRKTIYLNTVYEAAKTLDKIGFTLISCPYPKKGSFGNTGMVYDYFSPATALEKSRIVILNTLRAYQNFIQSEFPLLVNELDVFYGGNLISVIVDYSDPGHKFIFYSYYFRSVSPYNERIITVEDINDSAIMKENNLSSPSDLFRKDTVTFNGREYACFRGGGLNDMTILFGKYNCLTYLYELLKIHFDDYFENKGLGKCK